MDFCSVEVYPQLKTVAHKGQRYVNAHMRYFQEKPTRAFGSSAFGGEDETCPRMLLSPIRSLGDEIIPHPPFRNLSSNDFIGEGGKRGFEGFLEQEK